MLNSLLFVLGMVLCGAGAATAIAARQSGGRMLNEVTLALTAAGLIFFVLLTLVE